MHRKIFSGIAKRSIYYYVHGERTFAGSTKFFGFTNKTFFSYSKKNSANCFCIVQNFSRNNKRDNFAKVNSPSKSRNPFSAIRWHIFTWHDEAQQDAKYAIYVCCHVNLSLFSISWIRDPELGQLRPAKCVLQHNRDPSRLARSAVWFRACLDAGANTFVLIILHISSDPPAYAESVTWTADKNTDAEQRYDAFSGSRVSLGGEPRRPLKAFVAYSRATTADTRIPRPHVASVTVAFRRRLILSR